MEFKYKIGKGYHPDQEWAESQEERHPNKNMSGLFNASMRKRQSN